MDKKIKSLKETILKIQQAKSDEPESTKPTVDVKNDSKKVETAVQVTTKQSDKKIAPAAVLEEL